MMPVGKNFLGKKLNWEDISLKLSWGLVAVNLLQPSQRQRCLILFRKVKITILGALFVTDKDDLQEDYQHRAQQYLHGDNAGKKNYVVVTNGKELCVFDFNHEVGKYRVEFDKLNKGDERAGKNWQAFLADFGVESAKEKKKQRRKDVTIYTEPKDERLSAVKRFGHQPEFKKPIGWDNKNFREIFKTKNLPFLPTEEFDWDGATQEIANRIIWGDNLAVMRALPGRID